MFNKTIFFSEQSDDLNGQADNIWNGQLAIIVYKHASSKSTDFDFLSQFITICHLFDLETVQQVKQHIFDDLQIKFGSTEAFWDLQARDKQAEFKQVMMDKQTSLQTTEDVLELKRETYKQVLDVYEKACLNFNNRKMYQYYLTFRLEDLASTVKIDVALRKAAELLAIFDSLWKQDLLSQEMYREWVKLLLTLHKNDATLMQHVFEEGIERYGQNDVNFNLFIASAMVKSGKLLSEKVVVKFFEDCLHNCKNKTKITEINVQEYTDFWELYLDYAIKKAIPYTKIKRIVADLNKVAVYAPRSMAEHFKSKILGVIYHLFGITRTRKYFNENKNVSPICETFFTKMFAIEQHFAENDEEPCSQTTGVNENLTRLHEDMLALWGTENHQVWIDYIKTLWPSGDLVRIGTLYQKAIKTLIPVQCQMFIQKYTLLNNAVNDIVPSNTE